MNQYYKMIAQDFILGALSSHPLPWKMNQNGWISEVVASDGFVVSHCMNPAMAELVIKEAKTLMNCIAKEREELEALPR